MARLLVVEDEPRIAALIAKALRLDGHEVVVAEDGDLGLFLAMADRVDAVVLDLGLPGMSGREVLRRLRTAKPGLPVVVLTARDDPASRAACLAAGATVYLTKPFLAGELRTAVAGSANQRGMVRVVRQ
ncbi:response regulator transcription factor [Actinokineospora sp.]|uniref:response regulator transcription factor n=1 Tax=Actinokineospora sp. TaxID=1872133 RepID=UPI003D6A6F1E